MSTHEPISCALKWVGEKLISIGTPAACRLRRPSTTTSKFPRTRMRLKVALDAPSRLTCTALTPSAFSRAQLCGAQVVAVRLDLELPALAADVLDHLEEQRMEHRLPARERQVGNVGSIIWSQHAEDLLPVELVAERLAGAAFLDAVEAGEVALVRDLPGDVERRAEIASDSVAASLRYRRTAAAAADVAVCFRILDQPLRRRSAMKATTSRSIALVRIVEGFLQAAHDVLLVATRLDLAHDRGGDRVEREHLLGGASRRGRPRTSLLET